ncbi:hypothetical protein M7I_3680 [Glarea lozoyensis 74030]|uniref:Uncharacterized protein n=1 Tax=Glarea lozoyensis (strain ATCC 74030 / MF5533) TaxID=1104152 RepID=H0EM53_GLAL7|nr:hypothetical protein M7I_3680 [Glarea lozoyensis 74030]
MHQLEKGYEIKFSAELSSAEDHIVCRIGCDAVIGTQHMRVLKHNIPACDFPPIPKKIVSQNEPTRKSSSDEFGLDDIEDEVLLNAASRAEMVAEDDVFQNMDNEIDAQSTTVVVKKSLPVATPPVVQMANDVVKKEWINHESRGPDNISLQEGPEKNVKSGASKIPQNAKLGASEKAASSKIWHKTIQQPITQGSKNRSLTLSSSRAMAENRTSAGISDISQSGAYYEDDVELPEKPVVSFLDQHPDSSFGNDSLGSLEAGMLELYDPMTRLAAVAASPKLNSSFVDGVFDFEAFNNGTGSQESRLSLSAYQPAGLYPPAEKYTKEATKRARSPTPDGEAVKCRRVTKDVDTTRITEAAQEEFKPVYPEWLNEFDADLINGFKDFVDFVD